MDLLRIVLVLVAGTVTASGVASVYFRRDNSTNWLVILVALWVTVLFAFAYDFAG